LVERKSNLRALSICYRISQTNDSKGRYGNKFVFHTYPDAICIKKERMLKLINQ